MGTLKRIILFLALNFLVIITITTLMNLFNIQPFLHTHGLNYRSLMIFCMLWGMGGALISLALSRKMALWVMRVKLIKNISQNREEQNLYQMLQELSIRAQLPVVPQIGIYESNEVNAFATGPSQKKSLVAVSRGLLNRMKQNEIRAILAHEISHIKNGDMVTMTLLQGVVNAFVMFLARALAFFMSSSGKGNRRNQSMLGYIFWVYLFEICFMILGSMLTCAYSRYREYRADYGGARLAGKQDMIEALQALRALQEIRDPIAQKQTAIQTLKISGIKKRGLLALLGTHPAIEDRIQRLKNIQIFHA